MGTGETRVQGIFISDWQLLQALAIHLNLGYEVAPGDSELNNFRAIAGLDAALIKNLTLAADVLGRWEPNGDGIGDTILDLAVGTKWNLWRNTVLSANVQVPLNRNEGLRSDLIWFVGLENTY